MVREFRVHAAQLDFWHVARRAFVRADGTGRGVTSLGLSVFGGG